MCHGYELISKIITSYIYRGLPDFAKMGVHGTHLIIIWGSQPENQQSYNRCSNEVINVEAKYI